VFPFSGKELNHPEQCASILLRGEPRSKGTIWSTSKRCGRREHRSAGDFCDRKRNDRDGPRTV